MNKAELLALGLLEESLEEYQDNKKTAADAANIDDGTVEKGLPTNFSTSNDN